MLPKPPAAARSRATRIMCGLGSMAMLRPLGPMRASICAKLKPVPEHASITTALRRRLSAAMVRARLGSMRWHEASHSPASSA